MTEVVLVCVTEAVPTVCVTVCVTTEDVPLSAGAPQAAKPAVPMPRTLAHANPRRTRADIDLPFMIRPVPDELLNRTLDRVESATDLVHKTVLSPVRQLSGLVQGITSGLEFLIGSRRKRNGVPVPQDEMFI